MPAGTVTDAVPPPCTVTFAVSYWPELSRMFSVEWKARPEARSAASGHTTPLLDTTDTPCGSFTGNPIWPLL